MKNFNTSLVREKITFTDEAPAGTAPNAPTTIRSNRIFLRLEDKKAGVEKVVIRAQNMHSTLRLAAKVLYAHHQAGALTVPDRVPAFDWAAQWESVVSSYDKEFVPGIWAAAYINGQSVFRTTTSPFVDVIEKCALLTLDNYDATIEVTQNALKQVGRAMRIEHSSNVAATFSDSKDGIRCGIVHRSGSGTTTFSFMASGGQEQARAVQALNTAAAFLEQFNMRFTIHTLQEKVRLGEAAKISPESKQIRGAIMRQSSLAKVIKMFEENYDVRYRPEKPDIFA